VGVKKVIFILVVFACLTPWVTPPLALVLGLFIALFVGHPFLHLNHKATHLLLQVSVVGLGFGMHLSQNQFGLWSAIAIHDTSSVVGAAGRYGPEALQIATTVKLARALWIIPVSLLAALFFRDGNGAGHQRAKISIPWFIGLFVVAILLNTWLPLPALDHAIVQASHAGLTLTLFLIGSGLSMQVLKNTGVRPLLQGIILWVLISVTTLWAIMSLAH